MTLDISLGKKKGFFAPFNISASVSLVKLYFSLQLTVQIPVKLVEGLSGQLDLHEGAGGQVLVDLDNVVRRLRYVRMV